MKAQLSKIVNFLAKCTVKMYPLLDNVWFVLFLVFMVYDAVGYYAKYFNRALYDKLTEYDPHYEPAFYAFIVVLLIATAVFLIRTYKKALSHSVNPKEKARFQHYPNRLLILLLLTGVNFLVDESLKLIKGETADQTRYCTKKEPDQSALEYKPVLDYMATQLQTTLFYQDFNRMLPCLVFVKKEEVTLADLKVPAWFDYYYAKPEYFPILVDQNLDLTSPPLSSVALATSLFMAYDYLQQEKSPNQNVPSCLQRVVSATDKASWYAISSNLVIDLTGENSPEDEQLSKSQKNQASVFNMFFNGYYLRSFDECVQEGVATDSPGYHACVYDKKMQRIADAVYGSKSLRDYCAYR